MRAGTKKGGRGCIGDADDDRHEKMHYGRFVDPILDKCPTAWTSLIDAEFLSGLMQIAPTLVREQMHLRITRGSMTHNLLLLCMDLLYQTA